MKRFDFHGLRFQLLLVLKLFLICIFVAGYLIYQRPWVESFMKEKYSSPPATLQPVIDAIRMNKPFQELYEEVPIDDRAFLYDFWITAEPFPEKLPQELLFVDLELFSRRVERTLVSGSAEQRKLALKFCELGRDSKLIPILEKVRDWAERRRLDDFANQISSCIENLER